MARIARRRLLKRSGSGAIAAGTGGLTGILASGRAPALAQETSIHWLRWTDFVPASDALLKGITNARLVRQLREMNPEAKIITTADVLTEIPALYAAGADYVSVARLDEAAELCEVLEAAECDLLKEKRARLDSLLADREEVLS